MLKRLLELKPFVIDFAAASVDIHLTQEQWRSVEQMVQVLAGPYAATVRVQAAEFWGVRQRMDPCEVDRREASWNNQPADVCAGTVVDPRYRLLLTAELNKGDGRPSRRSLSASFNSKFKPSQTLQPLSPKRGVTSAVGAEEEEDDYDIEAELEMLAAQTDRPSGVQQRVPGEKEIDCAIQEMQELPRANGSVPIFEALATLSKDIHEAVALLSALPTTQVSVERLFSGLKLLLSDLRSRLKPGSLWTHHSILNEQHSTEGTQHNDRNISSEEKEPEEEVEEESDDDGDIFSLGNEGWQYEPQQTDEEFQKHLLLKKKPEMKIKRTKKKPANVGSVQKSYLRGSGVAHISLNVTLFASRRHASLMIQISRQLA
ncbi:unnamed protein product, partial [Cyprideis torosa]